MASQPQTTTTTPTRRSPLTEVVENWKESCLRPTGTSLGGGGGSSSSSVGTTRSSAELQQDAKTFFRYLSRNTQTDAAVAGGGRVLTTRSSHEEALAQLIQQLGPAFLQQEQRTSSRRNSQAPRLRALHLLLGALEGCQSAGSTATMSNGCLRLVGNFLTVHCGPIDTTSTNNYDGDKDDGDEGDDNLGEDLETDIRDTAVQALSALIEIAPSLSEPGSVESSSSSNADNLSTSTAEAIELRTILAQTGVEKRCALPDDDDDGPNMMNTGYGDDDNVADIRGGLSTLPRSKRSLCFKLLRSSVKGVSQVTTIVLQRNVERNTFAATSSKTDDENIRRCLIRFTKFATRCLIGESDPRCLLQLLELLHAVQSSFQSWFGDLSISTDEVFPNDDVFDAVVPYYPIQFTPPPNNPHGITREGLHSELLAVLTCTELDGSARVHKKPTMLSLTFNLLLEPLLPEEDETPSTQEKFEALEALTQLLFPPSSSVTTSECKNLTVDEVRTLSSAVQLTHDEASRGASTGGENGEQNRILAVQCRIFISRIAVDLEKADVSQSLWHAFVITPLDNNIKKLKLSPSYCRTSVAYAACLAASGGPKTLRTCLLKGLLPLLEFLEENKVDTEDSVAAVHGCAAFFSSCQVAIEKSKKEGVYLYPHPLEPYAERSCDLLLGFVEKKQADCSWSMKLALTTSLEFLLNVSTVEQLGKEELSSRICEFFTDLLETVNHFDLPTAHARDYLQYQETCGMALGSFVGRSAAATAGNEASDSDPTTANESDSILQSSQIKEYIKLQIIPGMLESFRKDIQPQDKNRFDRKALAVACSYSTKLADSVVQHLLESLLDSLKRSLTDSSVETSLNAISSIVGDSNNDTNALRAFHTSDIPEQILSLLSKDLIPSGMIHRQSLSQLALPETNDEHQKVLSKINIVDLIVRGLLPAYRRYVPEKKILSLLISVVDKIPPLSKSDEGFLFVRLPVLSVALQSLEANNLEKIYAKACETDESTKSILDGLSEFILSDKNIPSTKAAAGTCVHALVRSGINCNLECPVVPQASKAFDAIVSAVASDDMGGIKSGINYMSLLGTAAALRGFSSSSTAAAIATFLIDAACGQSASLSLPSLPHSSTLDLAGVVDDTSRESVRMVCASGYGNMVIEGSLKQLMRQRLVHICQKHINSTYANERSQAVAGDSVSAPTIGILMIACHIVSATDVNKGDSTTTRKLATIISEGLSSELFQLTSPVAKKYPNQIRTAKALVLTSILKLICLAPAAVNGLMLTMVSGLLRAFAVSSPETEVGNKLLALQALEQLASLDGARTSILAVKPAVVALLASAMNQKSYVLRSAAVDVRNAWCIVT